MPPRRAARSSPRASPDWSPGPVSMALGEYVSVNSQRDTERALLAKERAELDPSPDQELDELTAKDALAAHAEVELGIDPEAPTNPWHAAGAVHQRGGRERDQATQQHRPGADPVVDVSPAGCAARRALTPAELAEINAVARSSGNDVVLDALLLRLVPGNDPAARVRRVRRLQDPVNGGRRRSPAPRARPSPGPRCARCTAGAGSPRPDSIGPAAGPARTGTTRLGKDRRTDVSWIAGMLRKGGCA